ncbi:MAG: phosphoribosyltransferase [Promethearchaeota archaeon]
MDKNKENQKFFFYTPEIFYKDSNLLVKKIKDDIQKDKPFEIALGIARGGIVLAYYIATNLNISKFYTIRLKSYINMEQNTMEIIQEPPWEKMRDKKVLLIDDLVDNGITAKYLFNLLRIHEIKDFKFAVLVNKQKDPTLKPDYFVRTSDKWISFFWEQSYSEMRI